MTEKSSDSKTKSATSFATSVPEPRATPISACFKAGESFIPSPVIAITSPFCCQAFTIFNLCSGVTRAYILYFPTCCFNSKSDILSKSLPSKISPSTTFKPILLAIDFAVKL